MDFCLLPLLLSFVLGALKVVSGTVTTAPANMAVTVGSSLTLNCTSNVSKYQMLWQFGAVGSGSRSTIGSCTSPLQNGTSGYVLEAPTPYDCNVVIQNVFAKQAGQYVCNCFGSDSGAWTSFLAVIDSSPVCSSDNTNTHAVANQLINMTVGFGCSGCTNFISTILWQPGTGQVGNITENATYISNTYTVTATVPSLPQFNSTLGFAGLNFTPVFGQAPNVPSSSFPLCSFLTIPVFTSEPLTKTPLNMVVRAGKDVILNCTNTITINAIKWQFQAVGGKIIDIGNCLLLPPSGLLPYTFEAPTPYDCNLVISGKSVTTAQAGQYFCIVATGSATGVQASSLLAVVDASPTCLNNNTNTYALVNQSVVMTSSPGCYGCSNFNPGITWSPSIGQMAPIVQNATYVSEVYTVIATSPSLPQFTATVVFTALNFTPAINQAINVPSSLQLCQFPIVTVHVGGTLINVPSNAAVTSGGMVILNCTSSITTKAIIWNFQAVGTTTPINVGNCRSLPPTGYPPWNLEAPTAYDCNVIITNADITEAGQYNCIVSTGLDAGAQASSWVAVIEDSSESSSKCTTNNSNPNANQPVAITVGSNCYGCSNFTPAITWTPNDGQASPLAVNTTYISDVYTVIAGPTGNLPEYSASISFTNASNFDATTGKAINLPTSNYTLCTLPPAAVQSTVTATSTATITGTSVTSVPLSISSGSTINDTIATARSTVTITGTSVSIPLTTSSRSIKNDAAREKSCLGLIPTAAVVLLSIIYDNLEAIQF